MKLLFRLSFSGSLLFLVATGFAAQTNILLTITAPWRYQTNNLDGTNWTAVDYNASAWPGLGNALLYIEADAVPAPKNTPLPPKSGGSLPLNTYYFRTTFVISNIADVSLLVFSNLVDDGAVFYLNGAEIQRFNMSDGLVVYTNYSALSHEASAYEIFTVTGEALASLVEGTNILAVEVHQTSASSTDIVFGSAVTEVRAAPVTLTRGPYLQMSTPTSIVIRWRTDIGSNSRIIYGTNLAAPDLTNIAPNSVGEHIITLTNLLPDTKYFYSIGSTATNLAAASADQFFLTHPLPGTTQPLRIWVIGDAGTKNASQIAVRDAFYNFNGTNTVHAWLQLGDNAYDTGTDAEYQTAVFDMYPTLLRRSVTWPTLGNHETAQATTYVDTYPYFSLFTLPTAGEAGGVPSGTEHYYSFDLGMVHFICLDSMTADRSTNGAMLTWLRSDLAVNTNRWLVAFWHHPPYTKGSHNSDTEAQLGSVRTNFLPILEAAGVDLVLSGHSHCYERSYLINGHYGLSSSFTTNLLIQTGSGRETNGVGAYRKPDGLGEHPIGNRGTIYTVAGSSGQATTGTTNHPAMYYSALSLGSVVLDFTSNRLDAIFLRETGATNDSFTIIKDQGGTQPPAFADPVRLSGGGLELTVLCRAYRTNVVETATNLPGDWSPLLTNVPPIPSFSFTNATPITNGTRFFRVRRL